MNFDEAMAYVRSLPPLTPEQIKYIEDAKRKQKAEFAAMQARAKAWQEELKAERARVAAIPENKIFWELRRRERRLWRPLYRAYQRGEKASAAELDALVECADALLKAAKARADAGLEDGFWTSEWPETASTRREPYELHYAQEHQCSVHELRDLMKA